MSWQKLEWYAETLETRIPLILFFGETWMYQWPNVHNPMTKLCQQKKLQKAEDGFSWKCADLYNDDIYSRFKILLTYFYKENMLPK